MSYELSNNSKYNFAPQKYLPEREMYLANALCRNIATFKLKHSSAQHGVIITFHISSLWGIFPVKDIGQHWKFVISSS